MVSAVSWLRETMLGSAATSIAVIAIAATGARMLTGRLEVRRSITSVFGCFIIFGAGAITAGLMKLSNPNIEEISPAAEVFPILPAAAPAPGEPTSYDPYAGASVPTNRQSWTGQARENSATP